MKQLFTEPSALMGVCAHCCGVLRESWANYDVFGNLAFDCSDASVRGRLFLASSHRCLSGELKAGLVFQTNIPCGALLVMPYANPYDIVWSIVSLGIGEVKYRREALKVLVPVKRVVDYNVKVRVKADGSGVDTANAKMSMNPFDEIAVEEAVRLREAGVASEVLVVSAGLVNCQETLRTAMAIGADRALLIETDVDLQPLAIAKLLKSVCENEQPQLVLCGKQAIDDDANQTGQMLAALMNWPQATFASKVQLADGKAMVVREIDGGMETVEMALPAVISVDLRLNEPRYATLPNIMKAKKKPLDVITPAALGVDVVPRLKMLSVAEPPKRAAGIKLAGVAELVAKLKNEGVIA